jgi:hypothetical protein
MLNRWVPNSSLSANEARLRACHTPSCAFHSFICEIKEAKTPEFLSINAGRIGDVSLEGFGFQGELVGKRSGLVPDNSTHQRHVSN